MLLVVTTYFGQINDDDDDDDDDDDMHSNEHLLVIQVIFIQFFAIHIKCAETNTTSFIFVSLFVNGFFPFSLFNNYYREQR